MLTIKGYDSAGTLFAGATATLSVTCTAAADAPQDRLVINEIMYHPAAPDASFVEIFNTSASTAFDLSNYRLEGTGFVFPEGSVINPNSYAVVAKNKTAFASAYGASIPVNGEYPGQLSNGGETLRLVKPGATPAQDTVIDWVRFDNQPPWPGAADGYGPSLQLIDPAQDNSRVGNWAASTTNAPVRCTPGTANSVRSNLPAFPAVWIDEVLPQNTDGLADRFGHRSGWIELYNSGTTPVELSGYFLANNVTNLAQWTFPAGSIIGPWQCLLIWADRPARRVRGRRVARRLHFGSVQRLGGPVAIAERSARRS